MAKKTTKPVAKQYESNVGQNGKLKTNVYTTSPRTEIVIFEKLDDDTNDEIRFAIDAILKEKGF